MKIEDVECLPGSLGLAEHFAVLAGAPAVG
jgi:hypothetical protein